MRIFLCKKFVEIKQYLCNLEPWWRKNHDLYPSVLIATKTLKHKGSQRFLSATLSDPYHQKILDFIH